MQIQLNKKYVDWREWIRQAQKELFLMNILLGLCYATVIKISVSESSF